MPDHAVTKIDGKFEIVPSDAQLARAGSKADKDKTKSKLTDEELRALLERILLRLEALEKAAG